MVPEIQSLIRRSGAIGTKVKLLQAKIDADDDQEQADDAKPDDDLAPQSYVLPQRRRINPVYYGTEPVPESLARRRGLNELTIDTGYIDFGTELVVCGHQVQRSI